MVQDYYRRHDLSVEGDNWDLQREVVRQRSLRSKRLHSIPEVAEDEAEGVAVEAMGQRTRFEDQRPGAPHRGPRVYHQDSRQHNRLSPSNCIRRLQRQRSSPRYSSLEDRGPPASPGWIAGRQITKSPDSGLDCCSEEEGSLGYRGVYSYGAGSPIRVGRGPNMRLIHCEGPVERRALATGRKRTMTRQSSTEEDYQDVSMDMHNRRDLEAYYHHPHYHQHYHPHPQRRFQSEGRLTDVGRSYYRENRAHSVARLNRGMDEPLVCVTGYSLRSTRTHTPSPPPPHDLPHSSSSICCFKFTFTEQ